MTNKQLAAARRAINQFPGVRPIKHGETITPIRQGIEGAAVTIAETMSDRQVEFELTQACGAMA